jgi:hypothetical protein
VGWLLQCVAAAASQLAVAVAHGWQRGAASGRDLLAFARENLLLLAYDVATDVWPHWMQQGIDSIAPRFVREQALQQQMAKAGSYREWKSIAMEADRQLGNNAWKMAYECEVGVMVGVMVWWCDGVMVCIMMGCIMMGCIMMVCIMMVWSAG